MSVVENGEESSAKIRRRRLSQDDERAIAQLYAETRTPTAEIRERFGIGESSLYRVVQRHGVALRGRTGPSSSGGEPASSAKTSSAKTSSAKTSSAKTSSAKASAPKASSVKASSPRASAPKAAAHQDGAAQYRFRIRFQAESVFEASDVRDALRQAESLGATDITAVARVN